MSNTVGLILIGLFIGGLMAFVIIVEYVANHYPDTRLGKICKAINAFIERFPSD